MFSNWKYLSQIPLFSTLSERRLRKLAGQASEDAYEAGDVIVREDGRTQTLHIHLEEYAPGGKTSKHGHVNEAAFYILDGTGYEIHDGVRYDWKAGDIAIVHMNCVHQHFNASPDKPARALVMKPKPLLIFMNMLFQQTVIPRPKEAATPAGEGYVPRHFETNHNHED